MRFGSVPSCKEAGLKAQARHELRAWTWLQPKPPESSLEQVNRDCGQLDILVHSAASLARGAVSDCAEPKIWTGNIGSTSERLIC